MEHSSTSSDGYRVTFVGVAVNALLALIKLAAGIIGNSTAMVADAFHSLSDLATDAVVYISLKVSGEKPDDAHPYGHGRAETIGAAIVAGAVVFVGLGIAWEVFTHVVHGSTSAPTALAAAAAVLSLVGKELLYRYTLRVGHEIRSESIVANAVHHRTDALSSLAALIGILGAIAGYSLMDPLAAIVVGLMITASGGKMLWESVQNLMDRGVSPEERSEIQKIIGQNSDVLNFHELKTRKVGKDTFVDCHIQLSPRISISEAHNIAETVRAELRRHLPWVTDVLVHIDAEDDREGRHYNVNRPDLVAAMKLAAGEFPELDIIEDDITLHYFLHRVCVELDVELKNDLTPEKTGEAVKRLMKRILENTAITEVTVKQVLGKNKQ